MVNETAENLEELRSGILELRVVSEPGPGDDDAAQAGFELMGSFQLPEEGELPVADLRYMDLSLDEPVEQGFISTGEAAFIEVDGSAYELPPEQTGSLLGGAGGGGAIFEGADVGEWIIDPVLATGEALDGAEVDRVTGEMDVVAALNDLITIAQRFGGAAGFEPIEGDEARRLENAVRSSRIEVISGAEDRLLRRLLIDVDLALDEGLELAEVLGPLGGASFTLDMSISEPNQPVEVEAPTDASPFEELVPAG